MTALAMIDPASVAFDIDGVVADTMNLFLDIAREQYNIRHIRYEDIRCYMLEDCLDMDKEIIEDILFKLVEETRSSALKPMDGAADVLAKLGGYRSPVLFVTARHHSDPIREWMHNVLPLDPKAIDVIATGSFDAKIGVLKDRGISYFVEDRLDTCFLLEEAGITPILFRQPWNRQPHPFVEVGNWQELESLISF